MLSFFKKNLKILPDKDPMDWSLTENSTEWHVESYCRICKATVGHLERMSDMCNSCGSYNKQLMFDRRARRKIVADGKWVVQLKYDNSENGYTIVEDQ